MNLVMIGRFQDVTAAAETLAIVARLEGQARKDDPASDNLYAPAEEGSTTDSYSKEMLKLLSEVRFHDVRPEELEQFLYDVRLDQAEEVVTLRTDESDISAFLKLFIHRGAKIEIYSAHFHGGDKD